MQPGNNEQMINYEWSYGVWYLAMFLLLVF